MLVGSLHLQQSDASAASRIRSGRAGKVRQGRGVAGAQNASTRRQAGEGHGWLFNRRTGGAPTRRQARWRMGCEAQGAGGAGGRGPKQSPERRPVWDRALNTMLAPLRSVPSHSPSPTPSSPCPHHFSPPPSLFKILKPQTGWRCPQVPAGARDPLFAAFRVPARMPAGARRCLRVPAAYYLQHFRCLSGCLQMPKSVPAPLFISARRCPRMS